MSDFEVSQLAAEGPSAGTLLRRAREAAGLHVAGLAVSLKVPVAKLEALENDRYELMPDMVFVRALASSVCRVLKIDPQPVLGRLPQSAAPRLVGGVDGINTPFRSPSDAAPPGWTARFRQPVFLAVFALLLGALVLVFLPNTRSDEKVASTPAPSAVNPNPAPSSLQGTPAQPALTTSVVPVSTESVSSPAAGAAAAPELAAPAAPVVTPPAPQSAASLPATPAMPAASAVAPSGTASGLVVVRTKAESWVEITDAKGGVAVRKVLGAGEVAGATGALPLQVTIGRADATEVQVRGQPFDLRAVSRDNVARFVVK